MEADSIEAWAALTRKNTLAIVGLGGAGAEAAHDLVDFGIPGVRAFAINTDARHLVRIQVEERILIGERVLRGRGSGGNREAVLDAAEESRDELSRRLSRFEIVFLLAGLGGGTGSALLPYLTTILRKTETLAIPIAFLPFHVELESNSERRTNVLETLQELETMGGLLLLLENEKLRRFDALPLHRVFHVRNAYVHSLVASLVDILENPSSSTLTSRVSKATCVRPDSPRSSIVCITSPSPSVWSIRPSPKRCSIFISPTLPPRSFTWTEGPTSRSIPSIG